MGFQPGKKLGRNEGKIFLRPGDLNGKNVALLYECLKGEERFRKGIGIVAPAHAVSPLFLKGVEDLGTSLPCKGRIVEQNMTGIFPCTLRNKTPESAVPNHARRAPRERDDTAEERKKRFPAPERHNFSQMRLIWSM